MALNDIYSQFGRDILGEVFSIERSYTISTGTILMHGISLRDFETFPTIEIYISLKVDPSYTIQVGIKNISRDTDTTINNINGLLSSIGLPGLFDIRPSNVEKLFELEENPDRFVMSVDKVFAEKFIKIFG